MEHENRQDMETEGTETDQGLAPGEESAADEQQDETPPPCEDPQAGEAACGENPEPEVDWKDKCLRALAELDNANKTVPKRIQEGIERFKRGHLGNLLELADGFERALNQPREEGDDSWREGVESLQRLLVDILARSGVKPVEAKGRPFDPAWHEAVSTLPAAGVEDGTILEVLRTGWSLDSRLLRAALVIVARQE